MSIYPLPMRFQSSVIPINVEITRERWTFASELDERNFNGLSVSERLDLRREFEAQVDLAKATKGVR